MNEEVIVIWEAPKIIPPEFRLYYNKDNGKVICYTCEKLEGNFIVVDAKTFAESRPDIRVINGKIVTNYQGTVISKLMPHDSEGISCEIEDVSIIASHKKKIKKWKLNTYEL